MKFLHIISFILIVVGGLNWGLVGAFDYNLVHSILGSVSMLERIVYVLVGLAAIYEATAHGMNCKACSTKTATAAM